MYTTKNFLLEDTDSSAYVLCYYNPKHPSPWGRLFIRIADCNRSYFLSKPCYKPLSMVKMLDAIISVLNHTGKKYSFTQAYNNYKLENKQGFSISVKRSKRYMRLLKTTNNNIRDIIILERKDEALWEKKIATLVACLTQFKEYLLNLQPTKTSVSTTPSDSGPATQTHNACRL